MIRILQSLFVIEINYFAFATSRFLISGKIRPRAVSTIGVITFNAVEAISPSTYIPRRQHAAVTKKHQPPATRATVWFFVNLYSGLNLLRDYLRAIYAANTHK